ncbi:MobF family relaxase [Micromonospora sp. NPDC048063]|uniref:MobF family relaxase n=1 Tax=Micromonospora sp. NPDC048063 TaxID=3364256 RepID=UPI003723C74A
MTLHPLHGGDGYTYLTREVATADVHRARGQAITDYYHAEGNPPGEWIGRARAELAVEGTVTEAQMKALFGEGLHPNATALIEQLIDDGMSAKAAEQQVRLGRKPLAYEPVETYRERVDERYAAYERITGHPPTQGEKTRLARAVGAKMFAEQHGRRPRDSTELRKYIAQVAKPKAQAVTGYDLVFTPPKSVSVLWGLGDDATRRAIEEAHEQAWRSVISDAESTVIKTRAGRAGVAQLDAPSGVIAAAFRHHDSRTGDPNLHTHVAIANRVKAADGRWRTIDGRALFAAAVSMSESYNARVVSEVAARLGATTNAVDPGRGRRPVHEIAGVHQDLLTLFSGRSATIASRTAELVDQYARDHGHEPTEEVRHKLVQQATLDSRPAKPHARSLGSMRAEWRARAVETIGARRVDRLLKDVIAAARKADAASIGPGSDSISDEKKMQLAHNAVNTVEQQRATWTRHHIEAEVRRQLSGAGLGARGDLAQQVTDLALHRQSIRLTMPSTEPTMPELTRSDGESVFTHSQTIRYSSPRILNAEDRVVSAARTEVIAPVSGELFDRTLQQVQTAPGGRQLDPGQIAVARAFATDARLVVAGIGPAGAGKTTTMNVVARAVEASGGRVIGLAPSARAAEVLSKDIAVPAHTLHRWIHHREKGSRAQAWQLRAGDVLLVDEAGMAGTLNLDAIISDAHRAGAVVRLLGDPQQLGAVESGGMLRLVQQEAGAVELDQLHRFADPEEGAASLNLRDGTDSAWRWYWSKDRIQHGDRDTLLDRVYQAWQADTSRGHVSLMVAPTNNDTRQLNDRARADRVAAGEVEAAGVLLHDGTQAGRGDLIVTRRNESRLRLRHGRDMVLNGALWTVDERHDDGSLTVRQAEHGGRIRLPHRYVAADVELAYATTIHRTQGMTVDKVHALVDASVSRVQAYVALTRGRVTNSLYTITEAGQRVHDTLDSIRRNFGAAVSATEFTRTTLAEAEHLPNLAARYLYAADQAAAQRHRRAVETALGDQAKTVLTSRSWPRLAAAINRAERAGWSPADILDAAGIKRLDGAADPAALLAHRVRVSQQRAAQRLTTASERPLAGVTDVALARLRARASQRLADAETALAWAQHDHSELPAPIRARGRDHPAWPERPYGALTDAALAQAHRDSRTELDQIERQLAAARRQVREATTPNQATAASRHRARIEAHARAERDQAEQLRKEQRLRTAMRPDDRAREAAQRLSAETPRTSADLSAARASTDLSIATTAARVERARLIISRIDDEATSRRSLPTVVRQAEQAHRDGRNPSRSPAEVPEWIADVRHRVSADTSRWSEHLEARREHLAARLADLAHEVARQQPAWAVNTLGQRPSDADAAAAWDRSAALSAAYRQSFGVADDDPRILGRQPRPTDGVRRRAYEETTAAIEPVRAARARTNRAAAAEQAREELRRKLQRVSQREPIAVDAGRQPATREEKQRARRDVEVQQANRIREDREREQRRAEQERLAATQRRDAPGPQRGVQM